MLSAIKKKNYSSDTLKKYSFTYTPRFPIATYPNKCMDFKTFCKLIFFAYLLLLQLLPDINLITTGGGVNPPLPTAGPRVRLFNHAQHVARVQEIHDCVACGTALADFLLDHLNVGV